MYNNDLVQMDDGNHNIDTVWPQVKKLSTGEKAELVKRLLGQESGLVMVSTSSHLVDYIIAQMSLLSHEGLAHVLRAIASRMTCDNQRFRS